MGGACWGLGEEVRGLTQVQIGSTNSPGVVKYSIGNGVAKEFMCTHGLEQWCGNCLRE